LNSEEIKIDLLLIPELIKRLSNEEENEVPPNDEIAAWLTDREY
jgi:hypothetical protein